MNFRFLILLVCLAITGCTALGKMGQVMLNPSIAMGDPGEHLSQFSLSLYASPKLNLNPNSAMVLVEASAYSSPPLAVSVSADSPVQLTDKLQAVLDTLRQEYPSMSPSEFDWAAAPTMSAVTDIGSYQDVSVHSQTPAIASAEHVVTPIGFQVLQLKDDSMLLTATYESLAADLKKTLGSTLLQVDDYRLMPGQFKFVELETINQATRYLAVIANYYQRDDAHWKRVLKIAPRGRKQALLVQFSETGVVLKAEG